MWTFFSLCQQSTYLLGLESVTRVWVGYLRGFWFGRGLAESVGFVWEWLHGLAPINQMVLNIRRLTSQTGGLFVNVLVCEPLWGGKSAGVCRCHWGYITLHMTRDIPQVKHTRWNVWQFIISMWPSNCICIDKTYWFQTTWLHVNWGALAFI